MALSCASGPRILRIHLPSLSSWSAFTCSPVRYVSPGLSVSPGLQGEPADGSPASPLLSCFLYPQPKVINAPHFPENPLFSPFPALHSALSAALLSPFPRSRYPLSPRPQARCVSAWPAPLSGLGPLVPPAGAFPCCPPHHVRLCFPGVIPPACQGPRAVRSYSFLLNWLSSLHQTLRSEGPGTMPDLFTTVLTASTIPSLKLQTLGLAIYSGNS